MTVEQIEEIMNFVRIAREHVAPGIPRFDEAYEKAYAVLTRPYTKLPDET